MNAGVLIAMALGIVGSSTVHLSKGVMRHGVTERSRVIYVTGVLMNFTNPLWVIAANRFAPTIFYTSMYGIGLLPLVVYSRLVLGERLERHVHRGVALVVAGTLLVGAASIATGSPSLFGVNRSAIVAVALVWLVGGPVVALLSRGRTPRLQEYLFGVTAGGMAALEALVKGVAQSGATGSTLLPQDAGGWALFIASFLGAAGAFAMIQWSYVRSCRASMMGTLYDVTYVLLPLVVVAVLVPGATLSPVHALGAGLLAAGVAVTAFPPPTPRPRSGP